jgi:hypothetical protein
MGRSRGACGRIPRPLSFGTYVLAVPTRLGLPPYSREGGCRMCQDVQSQFGHGPSPRQTATGFGLDAALSELLLIPKLNLGRQPAPGNSVPYLITHHCLDLENCGIQLLEPREKNS